MKSKKEWKLITNIKTRLAENEQNKFKEEV
jgi:hypothetical protein